MGLNTWDAAQYDTHHAFVWQRSESVLELLAPQPGERILDLGCGTGHLTAKIADFGATVWGIDADRAMIEQAQQHYPQLQFELADARTFQAQDPVDAVFSNAALHWIQPPDQVIQSVYQALKPGGRFVAEFGGKGNIQAIAQTLFTTIEALGCGDAAPLNPWYFPSISEYTNRLERQGFEVTVAVLRDRPTALEDGQAGLAHWLFMFANGILSGLSPEQQAQVIQAVETHLQPTLFRDGTWWADYRRLQIRATRLG